MKRREFLASSLSIGGLALTGKVAAQARPCPPQAISITGGATVSTNCEVTLAQPSWFREMTPGTWRAVAGSAGQRIRDVLPGTLSGFSGMAAGPSGITDAWCGMAVDERNAELLLVANGGHRDYAGNEVYGCELHLDAPRWKRLSDPTTSTSLLDANVPSDQAPLHADGRPRATHSSGFPTYANGRVWLPFQCGYSGYGQSSYACTSWDREWARELGADVSPISAARKDIAPWRIHSPSRVGASLEPSPDYFGYSAYDPVTQNIWSIGTSPYLRYWAYQTSTGSLVGRYTQTEIEPGFNLGGAARASGWLAIAPDLRLMFVGTTTPGLICMVSLDKSSPIGKDIGAPGCAVMRQTGPSGFVTGWAGKAGYGGTGAVYSAAARSIFWMEPGLFGSRVRQMRIPVNPMTTSWGDAWSEIIASDGPQTASANGIYSKFNLVTLGGEDALVCVTSVEEPVQVFRLKS